MGAGAKPIRMKKNLKLKLISGFTTLLLIITVVACLFFTLQSLSKGYVSVGGTSLFRVVTGSMEPKIPTGSLLISKDCDIEKISVDDIVCYRSSSDGQRGMIITHRVIGIYKLSDGSTVLQAKGDANLTADNEFVTQKNLIGRVVWHTGDGSKMAKVIDFLTSDFGFLACVILPVILIAVWIFKDAIKSMKKAISEAEEQLNENSENTPKADISEAEYKALYEKIEEELRKELKQDAEIAMEQNEDVPSEDVEAIQDSAEASTDISSN